MTHQFLTRLDFSTLGRYIASSSNYSGAVIKGNKISDDLITLLSKIGQI